MCNAYIVEKYMLNFSEIKAVPRKVNVHDWRVKLDNLPLALIFLKEEWSSTPFIVRFVTRQLNLLVTFFFHAPWLEIFIERLLLGGI